jgi:hypothetical protein
MCSSAAGIGFGEDIETVAVLLTDGLMLVSVKACSG